jgi:hypothetical protein
MSPETIKELWESGLVWWVALLFFVAGGAIRWIRNRR